MGRLGGRAGDSRPPNSKHGLDIDILDPGAYQTVLGTNPFLSETDLEHFERQDSQCIVVYGEEGIVASSWMTRGEVFVHELHRTVQVQEGEHFSCRSYVHDDYNGRSLMSHMIHAFASSIPVDNEVWGLLYPANVASIRSCERIGWTYSGDYSTSFALGLKIPHERLFSARPAMDLTQEG